MGDSLNGDNILWYFMNSPFYDPTSNNEALFKQLAAAGPEGQPILNNRKLFEENLKTRFPLGVQFLVVAEPQGPGQPWVIQRQYKHRPIENGRVLDKTEIEVQGTWYAVGTEIRMAPSLLDIIQQRLVCAPYAPCQSALTHVQLDTSIYLSQVMELSKSLAHYSPATGHTYLPPSYEPNKAAAASRSRLGSLEPEPEPSQATTSVPLETSETDFSDESFLKSLRLTNAFGHEYMDENPLQGEPGAFVFNSSTRQVEARKAAAQATANPAPTLALPPKVEVQSAAPTPTPTPKPAATPAPVEAGSRKGSIASAPKPGKSRRKSKGLTSPTSPTGPAGPGA